jgi:hypothetical protein
MIYATFSQNTEKKRIENFPISKMTHTTTSFIPFYQAVDIASRYIIWTKRTFIFFFFSLSWDALLPDCLRIALTESEAAEQD